MAIGARHVLIAFNVELASDDLDVARGSPAPCGNATGGCARCARWPFPPRAAALQVSLNVTDYRATPLYRVVELIARLAAERGLKLERGELIGCLPLAAVEETAAYYLGVAST